VANTIKLKRGTSTPSTSNISDGEVAIDTSAKKLYINDSGTVREIGGGISNLVEDTTPQLGGNLDMQSNNISGTGTITATSVANNANGMRKITASTSAPSGGSDGDVWIKYTS
jgi:hypothetical protein